MEATLVKKKEKENQVDSKQPRSLIIDIICVSVILNPIFDILSFIFRNYFETNISISTFLRPVIPVGCAIYFFIKSDKKEKLKLVGIGAIYLLYAIIHLYIVSQNVTGWSSGGASNELQYICNFTFLVVELYAYYCTFAINKKDSAKEIENKKRGIDKLKKSIIVMSGIYVVSILFSIIISKSSYTYPETKTGYKGLIESGNSLSAILVLSLGIMIQMIKSREYKWRIISTVISAVTCIYLVTLIGTRVGMIGSIMVIAMYVAIEIIFNKNKKDFADVL